MKIIHNPHQKPTTIEARALRIEVGPHGRALDIRQKEDGAFEVRAVEGRLVILPVVSNEVEVRVTGFEE